MIDASQVVVCPCGTARAIAMERCPDCGGKQGHVEDAPNLLEKEIEAEMIRWLETVGFKVYKTSQYRRPRGMSTGIADLIAFGYGRTVFVEVKTRWGRQSEDQKTFEMDAVHKGGAIYVMPRNVAELQAFARDLIGGSG